LATNLVHHHSTYDVSMNIIMWLTTPLFVHSKSSLFLDFVNWFLSGKETVLAKLY